MVRARIVMERFFAKSIFIYVNFILLSLSLVAEASVYGSVQRFSQP